MIGFKIIIDKRKLSSLYEIFEQHAQKKEKIHPKALSFNIQYLVLYKRIQTTFRIKEA